MTFITSKKLRFKRYFSALALILSITLGIPTQLVFAQSAYDLPLPGSFVRISPAYTPAIVTGITIHPKDPLQFDFIIDVGDDLLTGDALKEESQKLINYFMATLTVPEDEMWVNLSPYEKDRIIAEGLGDTAMGRDMLAADYILKQLTASLMYPEDKLGNEFWQRIYEKAYEKFGTTEIPTDVFNKIWIVPETAAIYVNGLNVFVADSHLKVMMEEDYLALEHHDKGLDTAGDQADLTKESNAILKEVILPVIEKDVNEGKNFAPLRQMYHSMILATWYKNNLKNGMLHDVYVNQNKVNGIDLVDKTVKQQIYDQYIAAFKKGVYNYLKEDYDIATQQLIPRKYFSGGLGLETLNAASSVVDALDTQSRLGRRLGVPQVKVQTRIQLDLAGDISKDFAMLSASKIEQETVDKVFSFLQTWENIPLAKNYEGADLSKSVDDKTLFSITTGERSPPVLEEDELTLTFNASLTDQNPLIFSIELFRYAFDQYLTGVGVEQDARDQQVDVAVSQFSLQLFQNVLQHDDDLMLAYKSAYYLEQFGEDAVSVLTTVVEDDTQDAFTRMHGALALFKINSQSAHAQQVLKDYREKHDVFSEAIKLLEDYEAVDEDANADQDQPQHGMYITLVSLHGLIKDEQKLGIDPDTGGQVLYVLELAKALGALDTVDRVDLVTRLMPDFEGTDTPEYAQEKEVLSQENNVHIVRVPFAGDQYISKENLWDSFGEFSDNMLDFFSKQQRYPNMMWTHYADAGFAGAILEKKLNNTQMLHTVHSLGLPKLINTATRDTFEKTNDSIHIFSRIMAEEIHLSAPLVMVTNSQQEVLEQLGMYSNGDLNSTGSIPPGVNLEKFTYDITQDNPSYSKHQQTRALLIEETLAQLSEDRQELPPIALYARLDEKKNAFGLIDTFGKNKELQAQGNLYIGIPKTPDQLSGNDLKLYQRMQEMVVKYGLEGKIVFSTAGVAYMSEVYRYLVDQKGVFVNMAFTEPFGLMVIEAKAVGVPVVATDNGGPQESIHDGVDGLLVDVNDHQAVADALLKLVGNQDLWKKFSDEGIVDVHNRYTWDKTAQRGVDIFKKVNAQRIKDLLASVSNVAVSAKSIKTSVVKELITQFDELIVKYDLEAHLELIGGLMESDLIDAASVQALKDLGFAKGDKRDILDHLIMFAKLMNKIMPEVIDDIENKDGVVRLGIVGESGTGKTVGALLLQRQLEKRGYHAGVFHQDNYFELLPAANNERRRSDFKKWVGPQEVRLDLFRDHLRLINQGKEFLRPVSTQGDRLDIDETQRLEELFISEGLDIVIAEGTYVGELKEELDYYLYYDVRFDNPTIAKRKAIRDNGRGETATSDELNEILQIEHEFISTAKGVAHWVVDLENKVLNLSDGTAISLNGNELSVPAAAQEVGGIDFNSNNLILKQNGTFANIRFKNMPIIHPNSVLGSTPVIINIAPVTNFSHLLGLPE